MTTTAAGAAMAAVLLSGPPADDPQGRLSTFGQFVGTWDLDVTYHPEGEPPVTMPGEWRWAWILDGRAIQDVWRVPPWRGQPAGTPAHGFGTTIRLYDPASDAWHVTWFGAVSRAPRAFRATRSGDEIVMEALGEPGERVRWIFGDIGPDSFHWRNVSSVDDGATWRLHQEMVARRRSDPR